MRTRLSRRVSRPQQPRTHRSLTSEQWIRREDVTSCSVVSQLLLTGFPNSGIRSHSPSVRQTSFVTPNQTSDQAPRFPSGDPDGGGGVCENREDCHPPDIELLGSMATTSSFGTAYVRQTFLVNIAGLPVITTISIEEFDPGSARTLAAWLKHASRTRKHFGASRVAKGRGIST